MLVGTFATPAVSWPAERCRVVIATEPAGEPDESLPPEPRTALDDEALLAQLQQLGTGSVRTIAAATGRPKSSIGRALKRLARAGSVRMEADGWRNA